MFATAFRGLVLLALASGLTACERRPGADIADSPTQKLPSKAAVGQQQGSVSAITNLEQKLLRLGGLQTLSHKLQVAVSLDPERRRRKYEDLPAWCRRQLTEEEKLVISVALARAKDETKDAFARAAAVGVLGGHPHVSFLEEIAPLTKVQSTKERPYEDRLATAAVIALPRIADKRVIPHLIEAIRHPDSTVRFNAAWKLIALVPLPLRYSTPSEPIKFEVNAKDPAEREKKVKQLRAWWEENQQNIEPRWEAAWAEF